jgi:membrane protease YdiL (CAAX protease family)
MTTVQTFLRRHAALAYFVLTFALSWGAMLIACGPGLFLGTVQLSTRDALLYAAMLLGPSVAGLVMTGLTGGRAGYRVLLARLRAWRVDARWYALALLGGPLLIGLVFAVLGLFSAAFVPAVFAGGEWASALVFGLTAGLLVGIFEELGWTGFAVPNLRLRHGVLATGLIVGLVWGLWHYPPFATGDTTGAAPWALYVGVLLFSWLPPLRVLLVWLYDRTGSLPVVMLAHAVYTSCSVILAPATTGMGVVVSDLMLGGALWLAVAAIAVANRGHITRRPLAAGMA